MSTEITRNSDSEKTAITIIIIIMQRFLPISHSISCTGMKRTTIRPTKVVTNLQPLSKSRSLSSSSTKPLSMKKKSYNLTPPTKIKRTTEATIKTDTKISNIKITSNKTAATSTKVILETMVGDETDTSPNPPIQKRRKNLLDLLALVVEDETPPLSVRERWRSNEDEGRGKHSRSISGGLKNNNSGNGRRRGKQPYSRSSSGGLKNNNNGNERQQGKQQQLLSRRHTTTEPIGKINKAPKIMTEDRVGDINLLDLLNEDDDSDDKASNPSSLLSTSFKPPSSSMNKILSKREKGILKRMLREKITNFK